MNNVNQQTGLTLLELMVALAASLILLLGASKLFITTRHSYNITQGLSRLQENARLVMTLLPRDLRQSGALGCNSIGELGSRIDNRLADADDFKYRFSTTLAGYRVSDTGDIESALQPTRNSDLLPTSITDNVVDGTDIVVIRGARMDKVAVNVDAASPFQKDDLLAISDCHSAILFEYDGESSSIPSSGYGPDAQLTPINTVAYYIRENARGIPALYRYSNDTSRKAGISRELVPGVEFMRVLYGQDTNADGSANRWVGANDSMLDMAHVVAVRIGLLLRAVDENKRIADQRSYHILDTDYTPETAPDRYQRQLYTTTILLRNRALPDV